LAFLCATEFHVAWENRKNLGLEKTKNSDFEQKYNRQIMISMDYLISKKHYRDAIQLAKYIKNFDFINKLFINIGIDFAVEDFVQEWKPDFLESLVVHSCNMIVTSAENKQSFKVRDIFGYLFLECVLRLQRYA